MRLWLGSVAWLLLLAGFAACSDGDLYPFRGLENPKGEDVSSDSLPADEVDTTADSGADTGISTDTATGDIAPDTDTGNDKDIGLIWIPIQGGTFQMGSNSAANEQPVHEVSVPSFEMLKTEVTVVQYEQCVTARACTVPEKSLPEGNWGVPGRENHPVNGVTWDDAVSFCAWAKGRLPSESEWEYAASNGSMEDEYPWGDAPPTCDLAVFDEVGGADGCGTGLSMEVCRKSAGNTSHGLCDMAGNLAEWVQDWYHRSYTGAPNDGSAWEDGDEVARRVIRGGSLFSDADYLRAASRDRSGPIGQNNNTGFRCARQAP